MRKLPLTLVLLAACARPQSTQSAAGPAAVDRATITAAFVDAGQLEVHGEKTGKTRLALERLTITARTAADVAETSVEHVFRSDAEEVLEGTFRFPLPEGAILTGLAMEIDGKLEEGELVEREKARKAYEETVDKMLDPALLEWENGQTFKLRVFPIEPKKTKRVVIRFLAPLHRSSEGTFFAWREPSPQASVKVGQTSVVVDGKNVPPGQTLVKVADAPSVVTVERTKNAAFWMAHVKPAIAGAAPRSGAPQAVIFLCDRSRSMLEARGLQKHTVGMAIGRLGERDRFAVFTGDVRTRAFGGLHAARDKDAALAFVDGLEPDGASDVGRLLGEAKATVREARAQGLEPVVVYLGDANPTWGETRPTALEDVAKDALDGATMHVVLLGKSTDDASARALAAGAHGLLLQPKTEAEAERATSDVLAARGRRRIEGARVVGTDGLDVPSALPPTLYEGDEVALAFRAAKDAAPSGIQLVGTQDGKPFSQPIDLGSAKASAHVADRWAKAKIERLERDRDDHKAEIVETSLAYGVMSKYTSFLVLDSEEAYARFQIARKAKQREEDARVSGDVDGDGRGASVSPDHLQPGDPEVRIPAPADAQSVVVVFPFGETKAATFEDGMWVVRFLVDRRTPDGTYEILARVTHHDGRIEIVKLPYVVDTLHPSFDVKVTPKRGGFEIRATQRLTREEIEAQSPTSEGTVAERGQRYAHILTDAKRVEVRAPDGQILALTHVKLGEFVGMWMPQAHGGGKLRLVAVDRALNENVIEVEVPR